MLQSVSFRIVLCFGCASEESGFAKLTLLSSRVLKWNARSVSTPKHISTARLAMTINDIDALAVTKRLLTR